MVSKDLVAASSRPLVLAILHRGESYGYEIIQKVKVLSREKLMWTDGMLYPVLHRLERQGLVKSRWDRADSGRRRKYYGLTTKGRKILAMDMAEWEAVHTALASLHGGNLCTC